MRLFVLHSLSHEFNQFLILAYNLALHKKINKIHNIWFRFYFISPLIIKKLMLCYIADYFLIFLSSVLFFGLLKCHLFHSYRQFALVKSIFSGRNFLCVNFLCLCHINFLNHILLIVFAVIKKSI